VNPRRGAAARGGPVRPRGLRSVSPVTLLVLLSLQAPWVPARGAPVADSWGGRLVPLVYHGRPLPQVIGEIQRFTQRRIMIDSTVSGFQYSGIVKLEDVEAWIRDLPAIYPVEIIDCRSPGARVEIAACAAPQFIVIRSRMDLHQNGLRSAEALRYSRLRIPGV
jgi:hypothetical protein